MDMLENRRHFRLREFLDVSWKVEGQDVSGEGTVVNISTSGFLLQTDRVFEPSDDCVLSIDSGAESLPFSAKKGKIVWFRTIHAPHERYQCGVKLLKDKTDREFQRWLEGKINSLSEASNSNILRNMI